ASVVNVATAGCAIVIGGNDELVFIASAALQGDIVAFKHRTNACMALGADLVEEVILRLVGLIDSNRQHLAQPRVPGAIQVIGGRAEDQLFIVGVGRVDDDQSQVVAPAIAQGVHCAVVGGEKLRN